MRLLLYTYVVLLQLSGARARSRSEPFDRLLVAQARQEGFTLATADTRIQAYDVTVRPARVRPQ